MITLLVRRCYVACALCTSCTHTHTQVRDVGLDAGWRAQRLSHADVIMRMVAQGHSVNPLFSIPWLTTVVLKLDWLHCCDQGVAADFLGNCFLLLSTKLLGRSQKDRVSALWGLIKEWYRANRVTDQLQNLTYSMLKQPDRPPKLRCSAAQCRALVPCCRGLCTRFLGIANQQERDVLAASDYLWHCYQALSSDNLAPAADLAHHSVLFAEKYVALSDAAAHPHEWRIKPKLHLWLELCSEKGRPSQFWNYRDEDFGGSVAKFSRRRGGGVASSTIQQEPLATLLHAPADDPPHLRKKQKKNI